MNSSFPTPYVRDLVLIGGGHANVEVLRAFGMRPEPGVRLTTIAREPHSPYSGMLPGYIAGHYAWTEIHIDLIRLTQFAGSRFIHDSIVKLDPERKLIHLNGRPDIRYDLAVINTGGLPGLHVDGDGSAVPVKPIGQFLPRWQAISEHAEKQPLDLLVVGGGAGGVELALAIKERNGKRLAVHVVTASERIIEGHSDMVRRMIEKELNRARIELTTAFQVVEVNRGGAIGASGAKIEADVVLWTGGVEAPSWPAQSGLKVDEAGFIEVDKYLRSLSHPDILAGGDIASLVGQPRPKSGVYAVRAGPYLALNSRHLLRGEPPEAYKAQARALAILGVPGGRAVASRSWFFAKGKSVWRWKEWIDRKFMDRFNEVRMDPSPEIELTEEMQPDAPRAMRCGGCGSKLGADVLHRVLRRLAVQYPNTVSNSIGDDCAVVNLGSPRFVTTCDSFRPMISDPWKFGRIAAHHALNDIYAMGAEPRIALAIVSVPAMANSLTEDELFQVMHGTVSVLHEEAVQLVGGHSSESLELSLGLAVTGVASKSVMHKSGMMSEQVLILTKPLGTGVLLAGGMEGKLPAKQVLAAVDCMDCSSALAASILKKYGATGCTDVTGFGLLGHLAEMARASECNVEIQVSKVPLLPGVAEAFDRGIESSLQQNNEQALSDFNIEERIPQNRVKALVDPQTSGGLLASIPKGNADQCVEELRRHGYAQACVIGQIGGPRSYVRS